jgi:hypothetical protein
MDDHILDLDSPSGGTTTVTGRFRHPTTGADLGDAMENGTCLPDGIRPRITFTRRHNGVNVTTLYTGKVIFTNGPPSAVFIRGRFTRTTVNANMSVTTLTGDWETEKPT